MEFVRLAQRQLGSERLVLTKQLDYGTLTPNDAVVFVHPKVALDEPSLSAFLADGGRVAVLDDFAKGGSLLSKYGIKRIAAPSDPVLTLRRNSQLPIAEPSVQQVSDKERGRHPMTLHVKQVITNHPRALSHPDLTPVLEIASLSESPRAIAVTGVIAQRGRLLACSDPSIFINLMMRYPGNRRFAQGMIDYLASRGSDVGGEIADQGANNPALSPAELPASGPAIPPEGQVYLLTNQFTQKGHYGPGDSFLSSLRRALHQLVERLTKIKDEGMPAGMPTALSAALALWMLSGEVRRTLALLGTKESHQSLAPPHAGLGARAHLLAAPQSQPALIALELDTTLRAALALHLGIDGGMTADALGEAAQERGLSEAEVRHLVQLATDLRKHQQALHSGKPLRATEADLEALHDRTMRSIDQLSKLKDNQ